MDTVTHEDASREATEMVPSSLTSLKRPKMDFTNNYLFEEELDIYELQKQPQNTNCPLLKYARRESVVLTCSTEPSEVQNEKSCDKPQNAILTTPSASEAIDLQADCACKVFCITAERPLLHPGKEEQESVTKSDKLSLYYQQDADEALAESHTNDTNADTSIRPDCNRQGEASEDKPLDGYSIPARINRDERQVNINVSQIQVFNLGSSGEEVRFQSDCTPKSALHDAGVHGAWSQFAEVKGSNQKQKRVDFSSRSSPCLQDGSTYHICPSDYTDIESFYSNHGEELSGNLVSCTTTNGEIPQVQNCDNINVVWDRNPNGKLSDAVSKESDKTTIFPDVELACNIAAENVNVTVYDFSASKEESAAGKITTAMIKRTDHTTETLVPTRIREEPTEGHNYPGPFSVIDPEVWSEADMDGKEGRSSVLRTAPISVKECLYGTEKVSVGDQHSQSYNESESEQCKENNFSHLGAKPQAISVTTDKASLTYETENSHVRLDHQRKLMEKKNLSICGSVRQIKTEEFCNFVIKAMSGEEKEQTEHELKVNVGSTSDFTNACKTGAMSENDIDLTIEEDEEKVKEKEAEEAMFVQECKTNVQENPEILVKAEDRPLESKQRDTTELNNCKCICELKEGNCKISPVSLQQENTRGCLSDFTKRAQTLMAESHDDFSVIAFAPASDAVVPCQPNLNHSQNGNDLTAHDCNDRFSTVPSVFTFCDRMPEGFDTFEKIQLSQDYDDEEDATSLGEKPVFTSLLGQLLKTSEGQLVHSMPGTESNESEEIPAKELGGKEDVTRFECHADNVPHALLNSDSACNEFPNFTSAEHNKAPGYPKQQLYSDADRQYIRVEVNPSSTPSTVATDCENLSDVSFSPDSEMKKKFDRVLKELKLFFQISMNDYVSDSSGSTPQQCINTLQTSPSEVEASECDGSNCKEQLSDPELVRHGDSFSGDSMSRLDTAEYNLGQNLSVPRWAKRIYCKCCCTACAVACL